jgi:hypothetical protein
MRKVWIVAVVALAVAAAGLWWASTPTATPRPPCQPLASGDSIACATIDGFPIGQFESECAPVSDSCFDSQTTAALKVQDPHRPQIVRVRLYDLDYGRVCDPGILCTYSGGYTVFVFDLIGGTRQAVGVTCPGPIGCVAMRPYAGPRS